MILESTLSVIISSQSQALPPRSYMKEVWADLAIMVSSVGLAALAGYAIAAITTGPIGVVIAIAVTVGILVGVVGCIAYHLLNNGNSISSGINDDILRNNLEDQVEEFSTISKFKDAMGDIDERQTDITTEKSTENALGRDSEEFINLSSSEQEPIFSIEDESFEGLVPRDEASGEFSITEEKGFFSINKGPVEKVHGADVEVNGENLQFEISIRLFGNGSDNFIVSPNDTVDSLKQLIALRIERIDGSVNGFRLIFAGQQLDVEKSLADYNIQKGSILHRLND